MGCDRAETLGDTDEQRRLRRWVWRNAEHFELATITCVDWLNQQRLHSEIGDIPPPSSKRKIGLKPDVNIKSQHPTGPDA